jgi:hypothetical protein
MRLFEPDPGAILRRQHVEQREDIGVRIATQDLAQHLLRAAHRIQPVMDDSDAH